MYQRNILQSGDALLITQLIGAITKPGELVIDPAAGSFVVMRAANELGRDFIGCDIAFQHAGDAAPVPQERQLTHA